MLNAFSSSPGVHDNENDLTETKISPFSQISVTHWLHRNLSFLHLLVENNIENFAKMTFPPQWWNEMFLYDRDQDILCYQ